jgi:hypothetical protein
MFNVSFLTIENVEHRTLNVERQSFERLSIAISVPVPQSAYIPCL